jgi:hypothetical protein
MSHRSDNHGSKSYLVLPDNREWERESRDIGPQIASGCKDRLRDWGPSEREVLNSNSTTKKE